MSFSQGVRYVPNHSCFFFNDDDDDDDILWILIMYACNTTLCSTISNVLHCLIPVSSMSTTSLEHEHGLYLVAPVMWMYCTV